MTRPLFPLFLIFASALSAQAANCPVGGTTIFFGNGVNVTFSGAFASSANLTARVKLRLEQSQSKSIDLSCLVPAVAYDVPPFDTTNGVDRFINIAFQAGLISSVQVAKQFAPLFVVW